MTFTPSSSPFHKLYGHLSDPVRIFTISGEFSGHKIPLSEDLLDARMVMEAKLGNLPKKARVFMMLNSTTVMFLLVLVVVSSSLPISTISIEFVHGSHRVEGNITILGHDMTSINIGTLPTNPLPAVTRVSDNGLFIVRVPRNTDSSWYDSMTLISISGDPHMHHLAPPTSNSFTSTSNPPILASKSSTRSSAFPVIAIPHRRTLGFSPAARYIGAFDGLSAFTWLTGSGELIASYCVTDFDFWIMNPAAPLTRSYRIPDPPFYSSAAGRAPLLGASKTPGKLSMFFNGKFELVIPEKYHPTILSGTECPGPWYGDKVPSDPTHLYSPRSSRDGTRFLLQGWQMAPIVVDLSQVI
ncbi:uncharacterized protein EI90DRAFT_3119575 [Cantharellus anzutake]|uniref:uncharacterized protein n=1 Tax=Cantharellus anzutake TaxID=1750568 RepID=UPI001907BB15|nr:uncharacterized protein EI90DRAFT_3119575 [Cantharellus anzutake]KAF8336299.1 hypothetical protein EI90DRAFT_3119575 [Cantharellus anzutake]